MSPDSVTPARDASADPLTPPSGEPPHTHAPVRKTTAASAVASGVLFAEPDPAADAAAACIPAPTLQTVEPADAQAPGRTGHAAPPAHPLPSPTARPGLLTGDVRRTVLWLALPVLGEQFLNAAVAWNDQILAGTFDKTATGAVGLAAYIGWLMNMMFMLVGIGATAIVARAVGAGDSAQARRTTNQGLVLALLMGILGTIAVYSSGRAVFSLLNTSDRMAAVATRYLYIESTALIIESVTFVGAACLRGAGDTRTPMLVLGVVNVINVAASWTFARGFGWDVDGIAGGTATARFIGGFMMLAVLVRSRRPDVRLHLPLMRPNWGELWRIVRIGGPAALDGAITWGGHFAFVYFVTRSGGGYDGDTLLAAHMIGIRAESLSYLPAMAWATAAATLVGQNLGANQPDRARRCANEAVRQTMLLLTCMGVLYLTMAPQLYALLTREAAVIACGTPALRLLGLVQPLLAVLIVYIFALRGAGDTIRPMLFAVIGVLCLRVPVAYVCGVMLSGGLVGAWCGMYADIVVRSMLMAWRFHSGKWRRIRV